MKMLKNSTDEGINLGHMDSMTSLPKYLCETCRVSFKLVSDQWTNGCKDLKCTFINILSGRIHYRGQSWFNYSKLSICWGDLAWPQSFPMQEVQFVIELFDM